MATYNKYKKNQTVIGAQEVLVAGNYGILGSLELGYMLITTACGEMHAMSCANFAGKYTSTATEAVLTGNDWS